MRSALSSWRLWLWWLTPFAALAVLLAWETDWGRHPLRPPPPNVALAPTPVAANVLPEYLIEGGLPGHAETVNRTLFNPTRRPAPAAPADGANSRMQKGQYLLTGTAVAGDTKLAFLKEVAGGKARTVRQGDQINGVLVAEVKADRVKFTLGDDSEELTLKVAAGPKTTTAVAATPAAARQAGTGLSPTAARAAAIQAQQQRAGQGAQQQNPQGRRGAGQGQGQGQGASQDGSGNAQQGQRGGRRAQMMQNRQQQQ